MSVGALGSNELGSAFGMIRELPAPRRDQVRRTEPRRRYVERVARIELRTVFAVHAEAAEPLVAR